jgi:putative ABC transport system permease protein
LTGFRVHERTHEIGLLRALGVTPGGVSRLFLMESTVVAVLGGAGGVLAGLGLGALTKLAVPGLPLSTPPMAIGAALAMSLLVGIASGYLPARRAASLDPIEALREE